MSRFGQLPVQLPKDVKIETQGNTIKVTGPKGTVEKKIANRVNVVVESDLVKVSIKGESKQLKALQGTTKSHISNMVEGVTKGWVKELELAGSGYRAEVRGKELVLNVGHSHPINFVAPDGIAFKVEKTKITVEGVDKDEVGQIAALIRETRKPDPYKAKGVKYIDEIIKRKAGKQAAKTA